MMVLKQFDTNIERFKKLKNTKILKISLANKNLKKKNHSNIDIYRCYRHKNIDIEKYRLQ